MANNTLTPFIPDLYAAFDVLSRELTGYIPAVTRDSSIARAAQNEPVMIPLPGDEVVEDITNANIQPDTGTTTLKYRQLTMEHAKSVPIMFSGEETRGLRNSGMFETIRQQRIFEGMRKLVNLVEADIHSKVYKAASRAAGAAASTPFGTAADMSEFAAVLRILEENGAPTNDLQLVLGHAAVANLRGKQSGLFKVNESGREDMLRNGMTDRIMKMALRHSDAVGIHTKGTGTAYDTDLLAGYDVGDTEIHVDTGADTILAGDVVTFAGDTNKYVVRTGFAGDGDGDIVLNNPGLRASLADGVDVTIGGSYTANTAFARSAVVLATRLPEMPEGGDSALDTMTMQDPVTGLAMEAVLYGGRRQNTLRLEMVWGSGAVQEAHIATLMG